MGREYWSAILLSGHVSAFWGNAHFYRATFVYCCLCVCVCVSLISYVGIVYEDKLQLLFHTSLDSSVVFTGTRVHTLPLPIPVAMIHAFVLYYLPENIHNSNSVCMSVSALL